jgi:prepilin-type N-terminal cleavage/methylation domain-containing protein
MDGKLPPTPLRAGAGDSPAPGREGGYSLIEIVVSLAILALAGTIIVPGAVEMVERFDSQAKFRMLVDEIEGSRGRAVTLGQLVVLSDATAAGSLPGLPEGWQVTFPTPLVFSPAAVCTGQGAVIVSASGQRQYYALDTATCRLVRG